MNEYNSHWPTQEQHSLYRSPRQLKHSLQHEQFFRSHLQDCVSMHLLTTLAHTASLQLFTASIKYKVAIATMNIDTHRNILLRPGTKKKICLDTFLKSSKKRKSSVKFSSKYCSALYTIQKFYSRFDISEKWLYCQYVFFFTAATSVKTNVLLCWTYYYFCRITCKIWYGCKQQSCRKVCYTYLTVFSVCVPKILRKTNNKIQNLMVSVLTLIKQFLVTTVTSFLQIKQRRKQKL